MANKIGDIIENGFWLTGRETKDGLEAMAEDFLSAFNEISKECGYLLAPMNIYDLRPGDPRVPPVPDHIHGPDVRLRVAEAIVTSQPRPVTKESLFTEELEKKDLARLRKITKRIHTRKTGRHLTDVEADEIINKIGPDVAYKMLRANDA